MKVKCLMMAFLMSALVLMSSFSVYADDSVLVDDSVQAILDNYPELLTDYIDDDGTVYIFKHYILTEKYLTCFTDVESYLYYRSSSSVRADLGEGVAIRFTLTNNAWASPNFVTSVSCDYSIIVYTSLDVYSNYTCEELVFQAAPSLSMAGLTPNQMTQGTMKQIILLLPLVISLLVFSMGLRKALRMLLALLRPA